MMPVISLFALVTTGASASIVSYTNFDAWSTATATPITSIFFTEIDFEPGGPTLVNDQYAALGVLFQDHFLDESNELYPSDGRGLVASITTIGKITVDLTTPRTSVAVEYTSFLRLDLYLGESLIGSSPLVSPPPLGTSFIGVISATAFDRVVVRDPVGSSPHLDNLHFGAPIPAPAALAVLGLGGALSGRRRRTRSSG